MTSSFKLLSNLYILLFKISVRTIRFQFGQRIATHLEAHPADTGLVQNQFENRVIVQAIIEEFEINQYTEQANRIDIAVNSAVHAIETRPERVDSLISHINTQIVSDLEETSEVVETRNSELEIAHSKSEKVVENLGTSANSRSAVLGAVKRNVGYLFVRAGLTVGMYLSLKVLMKPKAK